MFGMLTGTISSGVLCCGKLTLLFRHPVPNLLTGSSFAILFGLPMLVLIGLAPQSVAMLFTAIAIMVVYFALLLYFMLAPKLAIGSAWQIVPASLFKYKSWTWGKLYLATPTGDGNMQKLPELTPNPNPTGSSPAPSLNSRNWTRKSASTWAIVAGGPDGHFHRLAFATRGAAGGGPEADKAGYGNYRTFHRQDYRPA